LNNSKNHDNEYETNLNSDGEQTRMITGEIRKQIDRIWDSFWSGGISNPMEVIEQMTYLLFIKRLDELCVHTAREKKANRLKRPIENSIFNDTQQHLRWSQFKSLGSPEKMYDTVAEKVFPFIKSLNGENSTYAAHNEERPALPVFILRDWMVCFLPLWRMRS